VRDEKNVGITAPLPDSASEKKHKIISSFEIRLSRGIELFVKSDVQFVKVEKDRRLFWMARTTNFTKSIAEGAFIPRALPGS
jgi:hypothetical protein